MRTSGKIALSFLSFIFVLLALLSFSINWMIGTPENVQGTVTKMLKEPEIAVGVAGMLIDQLLKDVPPELVAQIEGQRETLAQATAPIIVNSSAQMGQAAGTAFSAFIKNESATVNLHDVLNGAVAAMHGVNPLIPAQLDSPDAGVINITSDNSADHVKQVDLVNNLKKIFNLWWIFFIVALALLYGVSRLDNKTRFGAWRWPGFVTTIAAATLITATFLVPRVATSEMEAVQKEIAKSSLQALTSALMAVSFALLIVGISLITASFVIKDKA